MNDSAHIRLRSVPAAVAVGAKMPVLRVRFEVFGRVQGVNFRAYTAEQANKLGVVGYCRNTKNDSVEGELQGAQVRGACSHSARAEK